MQSQTSEITEETKQDFAYLSVEINRNSKGHTLSVTARTRPGESDENTILRARKAFAELASIYPPDKN